MNPSYKRRLCGILAAACMLTAATVPAVSPIFSQVTLSVAAAEETDFYKGLKYLKYSDYAEVIDCDQTRTTIKIPSSIGGLPVRVIAERAFYGCKSLETVTGGGNVQVIAPNAFSSCTALTSIGAMDSLQSIGMCFPEQYPIFAISKEYRRPCLFQLCIVAECCHSSNPDNTGRKCIWRLHQLADVCD